MKKIVSILLTVVMLTVGFSVLAAEGDFVESIGNKGAPQLVDVDDVIGHIVDENGDEISTEHTGCLVITPVAEAETSDEIPEKAKEDLLGIYEELNKPGVKISDVIDGLDDDNWVVRDLFDITGLCDDLTLELPKEGNSIDLTFDMNIAKDSGLKGMIHADGEWTPLVLKHNDDGTVTVTFEHFGQVAFLVPENVEAAPEVPKTGDASRIALWSGVMVVALAGVVLVARKKDNA